MPRDTQRHPELWHLGLSGRSAVSVTVTVAITVAVTVVVTAAARLQTVAVTVTATRCICALRAASILYGIRITIIYSNPLP